MAHIIYKTSEGKRVPSVTTINKIGQDSGGLIHWAWQLGVDGIDYRQARDDAAEGGNVGHALVDAAIKAKPPNLDGYSAEAKASGQIAYGAFQEWYTASHFTIIETEIALVSNKYKFGGMTDALLQSPDKKYFIGDWKSGALYSDHLCQIAAYGKLVEENRKDITISGYHLCRFNRETGDFTHAFFGELSDAWEAFKLKRQLYELLAKLKKRV